METGKLCTRQTW